MNLTQARHAYFRPFAALVLLALLARPALAQSATAENPIDGERAYGYLKQICNIGPRWSGSPGMAEQQKLLVDYFTEQGGDVSLQRFTATNPQTGQRVRLANILVQWHPERKRRILLCAHYDTRPLPDRELNPFRARSGRFIGANDGASGTALLMELAHYMPDLDTEYGVDFVLFDGEELVYSDSRGDPYFLGSTWFAMQYVKDPPTYQYRWGVLLDMVGDKDLEIYQERNSYGWQDTRPLVQQIWATADHLGVNEFVAKPKHLVRDDHVPLRNYAKIPTCNIIDFDYPYWHKEGDLPQNCSPDSLAKVGWVVLEWLQTTE